MNLEELAKYIVDYCNDNKINKIFICGNGGSGKTTLSKSIENEALKYGNVNLISTDDFIVSTELRKNSVNKWNYDNKEYSYRYTSSNKESYFIKNIEEIIYNIDHGIDCYYFSKKYKEENNIRQLHSDYFLTVIEGVGTAFLERKNALSIFLKCSEETERERREIRTKTLNRDSIELYDELRSKQFNNNILVHENEFDMIVNTDNYVSQKETSVIFKKLNQGEIVLVDENDKEIGFGEKMDIHKRGVLHRAISVLILNLKGEMLLQQRANGKYHCPGMWSNATCTHPFPNESNIDAAHRRLQEEMGFDTDLKEIFQFRYTAHFDNGLTENEYDHVFLGHYDGEINFNPDEVNDYKWISIEKLKKDIIENSESYTEWFKIILEKYFSLNL